MGYSRKDFLRVLPRALRDYNYEIDGDQLNISHSVKTGKLTLLVTSLPNRILGGFKIERSEVKFSFDGFTPEEREEFMLYFDRGYRRGGG